ncbi:MAG: ABC transporter ATP-binding protein [Spirochaetaceae bacterium]|nr:MAG: ABC transporter ATP-binding protein [Spirochaetaceae bacterium]
MSKALLKVSDLKTYFHTPEGTVRAVDGVDLELAAGQVLGLVGESGCGKSVTALSILRLIPEPPGEIVSGRVMLQEQDLLALKNSEMRDVRGNRISMIFQEPMTSLNPVFRIGDQISEAVKLHQGLPANLARDKAVEMLKTVGIPSADIRYKDYPHQLSGGMRQRVMIAMAFSCNPEILIADEPTTALDVTIQAQILELMRELKETTNSAIIFITHNLGIIAENAQRVMVMYTGRVVESADVKTIFNDPKHPYTLGLLESIPRKGKRRGKDTLSSIPGIVPSLFNLPSGCTFSDRCSKFESGLCDRQEPFLVETDPGHHVRCWQYR